MPCTFCQDFAMVQFRLPRYVCEVVSRRASFMASAGIAALLKKMADYKDVVIAIDGSLFRYHPHFKNVMQSRISQVMMITKLILLLLQNDSEISYPSFWA